MEFLAECEKCIDKKFVGYFRTARERERERLRVSLARTSVLLGAV